MKLLRNYIIVLSIVAVITVALATMSVMGILTKADQVVIAPEDPLTVNMDESGVDDLARILNTALNNAKRLEEVPLIPETSTTLPLQTRTEGGVLVGAYSLHVISMIDRNAILEDQQTGEYYQLSIRDFSNLLDHKAFSDLPEKRFSAPALYIEDPSWMATAILSAQSHTIHCYTANGTFRDIAMNAVVQPSPLSLTTEEAAQSPRITATGNPDCWSLNVGMDGTMYLSQSWVSAEELYFPSEPGTYSYNLTAHWDLSTQRDWYGDVTYALEIHIAEPETPQDVPENTEGETSDQ